MQIHSANLSSLLSAQIAQSIQPRGGGEAGETQGEEAMESPAVQRTEGEAMNTEGGNGQIDLLA